MFTIFCVGSINVFAVDAYDDILNIEIEKTGNITSVLISPKSDSFDKEDVLATTNEYINSQKVDENSSSLLRAIPITTTISDEQETNVIGSFIRSKFSSDCSYEIIGMGVTVNGSANIYWGGLDPFNCDKVKMDNSFSTTGSMLGFSVGNKGVTLSIGTVSATATYSEEVTSNYSLSHSYSNWRLTGNVCDVFQQVTGYFTFGTSTYQISSYDSTIIW